jgi:hypothetical protein
MGMVTGQFTSACAITPYTGGAFPSAGGDLLFVAEPVHNLVHRDVLAPAGATFTARRGDEGREFLAAADSWFRPRTIRLCSASACRIAWRIHQTA